MSKVAITGNTSGTGTFTIAAPNSDTDRTLTLPDEAGTILTDATSYAQLDANGFIDGTQYIYQEERIVGITNYSNGGFSHREVIAGTVGTSATDLITITPSVTSNIYCRGLVVVDACGHHGTVGNGLTTMNTFYFDLNNSTFTAAQISAGSDSGNNPSINMSVSGTSFKVTSSVGSATFKGVWEIRVLVPQASGSGGATNSWTITRNL